MRALPYYLNRECPSLRNILLGTLICTFFTDFSPRAIYLKMQWEVGNGWTTAPMDSPSGPRAAHILWSIGWKSLKQKPSFLEGLSINSQVDRIIVPIQWLLCKKEMKKNQHFWFRLLGFFFQSEKNTLQYTKEKSPQKHI